ncbi:DUF3471 domain-containing protein [Larkinella sp. VNQ87]|uniref:DUF3471 domain-containing protein n=1 Tax=Larkinella sp. VNQ87 TaxID=3400921 RepID=UPI003C052C52
MKKLVFTIACLTTLSAAYASAPSVAAPNRPDVQVLADSVDLTQYVGKYKFEGLPFERLTIEVQDGKLTVSTGSEGGPVTPMKDPDTFDASGQATLKFVRDADKKVIGLTLEAQGSVFEGKKES